MTDTLIYLICPPLCLPAIIVTAAVMRSGQLERNP
jgi:hypothetical protein